MFDKIIVVACGVLVLGLIALLVWWLKVGKSHFIAKRCPERLKREESDAQNTEEKHDDV